MVSKFLIYGLVDPVSGQLRYIGLSTRGLKRPRSTEGRVRRGGEGKDTYKVNWIRGLIAKGLHYGIVIIQELPDAEGLYESEKHWIKYFRQMGCPLTNTSDGGIGGAFGVKRSPEF
jgi:hypothetical protein